MVQYLQPVLALLREWRAVSQSLNLRGQASTEKTVTGHTRARLLLNKLINEVKRRMLVMQTKISCNAGQHNFKICRAFTARLKSRDDLFDLPLRKGQAPGFCRRISFNEHHATYLLATAYIS